jgi:hypothetical protein
MHVHEGGWVCVWGGGGSKHAQMLAVAALGQIPSSPPSSFLWPQCDLFDHFCLDALVRHCSACFHDGK